MKDSQQSKNFILRNVQKEDKSVIMGLYREAIGSLGCTWSEEYPSETTFLADISRENLFCFVNTDENDENSEIIAAISIDCDEAVDGLACWNKAAGKMGELSRLVVRSDYQNLGIAPELIKAVIRVMKARGYASVHYLVSRHHKKALAAYAKLDFVKVSECNLFGEEWYCYEKII